MITTNAWLLGAIFGVFVVGIIVSLLGAAMYFGNPPALYEYPYVIGMLVMLALIITFIVGSIKFLHELYAIDEYHEDLYFRRNMI